MRPSSCSRLWRPIQSCAPPSNPPGTTGLRPTTTTCGQPCVGRWSARRPRWGCSWRVRSSVSGDYAITCARGAAGSRRCWRNQVHRRAQRHERRRSEGWGCWRSSRATSQRRSGCLRRACVGREMGAAGRRELAHALATLAHVSLLQGNLSAARELAEESMQVFQELGEAWGIALALHHLGKATVELGDPLAARSLLEESAALFRMTGDRQLLAQSLNALGLVALRQGDNGAARAQFEEALAVARETGDKKFIADALTYLGTAALRVGDYQQSAALYQQSLTLNRVQGYRDGIAEDLAGLAEVASLLGQPERAARRFGEV